jgi:CheY-like chemotaxis protein
MVVDDEEMVREAVTDILSSERIGVIAAEDGAEGLALYRQRASEISLILLDVSMPGMSGEDALRHLREYARSRSALTAMVLPLFCRNRTRLRRWWTW